MIWMIALVFVGLFAFLGSLQGAIRAACTLAGAFLGLILAVPLSGIMRRIIDFLGFDHPLWLQVLPPVVVFLLFLVAGVLIGVSLHQKASIHFQHKASDLQRLRWDQLERRVGLSLGVAQGVFFFVVLMIPIHTANYFTYQVASGPEDPRTLRMVNSLGDQIRSSGMDRVVAAYSPSPRWYIQGADIVGLIYHNPLLMQGRLWRYPTFLTLAERTEFRALSNDVGFNQLLHGRATISEIIRHPTMHAIFSSPDLSREVATVLDEDLEDLYEYLETGESPKYSEEPILGLWAIDLQGTVALERQRRPGAPMAQINQLQRHLVVNYRETTLTATPDSRFVLRKPIDPTYPDAGLQVLSQGTWERYGRNYRANIAEPRSETLEVNVETRDQLLLVLDGITLVFARDYGN